MSESSIDRAAGLLATLHASHDRLAAALGSLTADQATTQSFCADWSVAQVASHLGSGAEIFRLHLAAGLKGEEAMPNDVYPPIWDAWNAKPPLEQVRDAVATDAAFLDDIDALSDDERERWHLHLFGMEQNLPTFLQFRLNEHALHTWDVVVSFDPAATLPEDATSYVVDSLGAVVGWAGKPTDAQASVEVRTTAPERAFHLVLGPGGAALKPSLDDTDAAELVLPAEAFVRLVYGRLDPDHTPPTVVARGIDLDLLRSVFPGL
ncbi:MAG: maleylpyruvate isomerase family mycothiol-dependent enzyme [Nocardioides sp.]|nr:maleylpyruvate isomerase family mycothiol-dependent enzyme [Nocardioides sp.]